MKRGTYKTWWYDLTFGLLMLAVVALCFRLAVLMADQQGRRKAHRLIEKQQKKTYTLPARRGSIFIRTAGGYVPLAISDEAAYCFFDPHILADEKLCPVAENVADILSVNPAGLQEMLLRRRDDRFVKLPVELDESRQQAIEALKVSAVGITRQWRRHYPNGPLAGTVVGFCCLDGRPGGGLELALNKHLAARDGRRVVLSDACRREIWPVAGQSRPPRDGRNVYLTLDASIQEFLSAAVADAVEKFRGDETWGVGVVVEPGTGKILAMCSAPSFDPNKFNTAEPDRRTNRVITMPYEPGSVFKPLIAAAAVQAGALTWQTQLFCENGMYHARRGGRISDHGHRFGYLTLVDIVVHSSNIGMAKVGEKLGNTRLHAIVRQYGFGQSTGIHLPGESPGQVRPLRRWDGYSLRRVPFGQEVSVSSLQLTMAFCALANGGELLAPRLVDKVTDARHNVLWRSSRRVVRRVLTPPVAHQSVAVMQQVVQRGTGKACQMDYWTSFGKTGTAQVSGRDQDGRFRYLDGEYVGSFVGGAPVENPRVICLISIYRPDSAKGYYGSKVAAPYVRRVLAQTLAYLKVPPDRTDRGAAPPRRR